MTQFSETLTNSGLLQRCEARLFGEDSFGRITDSDSMRQHFTNLINDGLSRYSLLAMAANGRWQLDDFNFGDYAVATHDLASGQADYPFLDSFALILSVEVMQPDGTWKVLDKADEEEYALAGESLSRDFAAAGTPTAMNKTANSLILLPTPNYSKEEGIKVRYQRPPSYFSDGDTGKSPGFTELHHPYLVAYACAQHARDRSMSQAGTLLDELEKWERIDIPSFYASRQKDERRRMTPFRTNNK